MAREGEHSEATESYAYRFLLIWGTLAVLCFAIAAKLTAVLVNVPGLEPPFSPTGMYGEFHGAAVGWIYYYKATSGGTYLVYYPAGTKFVAMPYGKLSACSMTKPHETRLPSGDIATLHSQTHAFYLLTISALPHGAPTAGEITCSLEFEPTRTSFTNSAMDVWFLPALSNRTSPLSTLNFYVQIEGAENMQVFGARATSSSGVALEPDDESVITFTDVRREGLRDIMLVVIGAFIALGAAMALEAIRPYVELTAARGRRTRR